MRVLWFTNTPSLASGELGADPNLGSWISSLERHVAGHPDIVLGVAFAYGDKENKFLIDRTTYFTFPQFRDKGNLRGLPTRWRHKFETGREVVYYSKVIEQFKPDLIHIFGSENLYGLIINNCTVPVVIQIQGNLTLCLEKWFAGISFYDILRYSNKKHIILGYGLFHQYFLMRRRAQYEKKVLSSCKFIIGRTDWDRRLSLVFAPGSRYFKCNELLRDEFMKMKWSSPGRDKIILFSTLNPSVYKGLEVILRSASIIRKKNTVDFEWQIAGINGTEEIVTVTEKSVGLHFADNNIRFKGGMNAEEISTVLLNSNCYVHPSHIENSSNSICEAMMTGIPVIATYAGGTASILENGTDGILVQDGDPFALAGAILELAGSPAEMQRYSENSRRKALDRHNPTKVLADLMSIYANILST